MYKVAQVFAIVVTALAMLPALAHALEHPGKLRLKREVYLAVQTIYYPGFTWMGFCEPLAFLASAVLLIWTPAGTIVFWLTFAAAFGLLTMHVLYWAFIHRINKYWVEATTLELGSAGRSFFSAGESQEAHLSTEKDTQWINLRDCWEHWHMVRAGLSFLSFICLVLALAVGIG
jgi:hypothetical protein